MVERAVRRGHHVVAVARRAEAVAAHPDRVRAVAADAVDRPAMVAALTGCDAVVSTLGVGTARGPTTLYSEGIGNVLAAMDAHAIARLAVVSAAPVGPRAAHPLVQRRVVIPLLHRVFGGTYDDMGRMEAVLRSSAVDWVSVRPPRLIDRPGRGRHRRRADAPVRGGRSMRYDDLADALLDVLDDATLSRAAVYVAT